MPDLYNSFGAMHGTIMVFLAIVPLAFGAFGNFVTPLQIGAPDMAFPRVNMVSYQFYFMGGVIMFASFFVPGGAAKSGWTSYSPLATVTNGGQHPNGQTFWIIGHGLPDHFVLAGRGQFHHHHHSIARQGADAGCVCRSLSGRNLSPAFCCCWPFRRWKPPACLQLMDNLLRTSFFLPTGLVVSGQALHVSGGGSPLLWQHLFWFLAPSGSLCVDSARHGHRRGRSSPTTRASRSGAIARWSIPSWSSVFCPSSFGRTTCI